MKLSLKHLFLFLLPLFSGVAVLAQPTTKTGDGGKTEAGTTGKKKVLIVPWDPRMFNCNSDISRAISTETSQKYSQLQEALRKGMVEQLKRSFASTCSVISLIDDTAKMKADLRYVYTYTSMSYTAVNAPLNPTKADSAKMKQQSGINKGQIVAESDEAEKFMNTIVLSPNLLAYLKKKYGADYVVFINEIDLENDLGADPYNVQGKDVYNRNAIAHWTIFDTATGKRIAMGKNKATFASNCNTPKKISDTSFSVIAKAIFDKYAVATKPKQ